MTAYAARTGSLDTPALRIAFQTWGPDEGWPIVLLHGFPYDVRAFDVCAARLATQGARVVVPWLRGFGATLLRPDANFRAGQQAAIGRDLLALLDGLNIDSALIGGFDWGNRAACVVAALAPHRVRGLVACGGYTIQDIAAAGHPVSPEQEQRYWYQYYFGTERGRSGLSENRAALCELLWRMWSPRWSFTSSEYQASAIAFDNPDFVDVVIHSYRHRLGLARSHPDYVEDERHLATLPPIAAPTIVLEGDCDGVAGPPSQQAPGRFTGWHAHRVIAGAGHAIPQEFPDAFTDAVLCVKDALAPAHGAGGV